jgi:hypothetical protein
LLFIGSLQIWQNRQQRLQQDIAYARDQRARRAALKILAAAQRSDADSEADAAGRALLGYLSDKLNTPTAGLTTDNLIELLEETRVEPALIERVGAILHQIDIGRFAPVAEGTGQSVIADTRQLINDLEKSFGRRR